MAEEEKAACRQTLKNLDIQCCMRKWKMSEVLGLQEKVKNQYQAMQLQFCDIDEASTCYMEK